MTYELYIDGGSLTSSFTKLSTYVYSTNLFSFQVDRVANSLTTGLKYRFKFVSKNVMGYSEFSDTVRIGLGPLPTKPNTPYRRAIGNSNTTIGI